MAIQVFTTQTHTTHERNILKKWLMWWGFDACVFHKFIQSNNTNRSDGYLTFLLKTIYTMQSFIIFNGLQRKHTNSFSLLTCLKIMTCHFFGAKRLSKPMLTSFWLNSQKQRWQRSLKWCPPPHPPPPPPPPPTPNPPTHPLTTASPPPPPTLSPLHHPHPHHPHPLEMMPPTHPPMMKNSVEWNQANTFKLSLGKSSCDLCHGLRRILEGT